jgi:hypothetical protein
MARSTSSKGEGQTVVDKPITREEVVEKIREQLDKPGYDRRKNPPMHLEYMHQMASMMIMANLYNSSTGRDHDHAAAIACKAASALVQEWVKNKPHIPRDGK